MMNTSRVLGPSKCPFSRIVSDQFFVGEIPQYFFILSQPPLVSSTHCAFLIFFQDPYTNRSPSHISPSLLRFLFVFLSILLNFSCCRFVLWRFFFSTSRFLRFIKKRGLSPYELPYLVFSAPTKFGFFLFYALPGLHSWADSFSEFFPRPPPSILRVIFPCSRGQPARNPGILSCPELWRPPTNSLLDWFSFLLSRN